MFVVVFFSLFYSFCSDPWGPLYCLVINTPYMFVFLKIKIKNSIKIQTELGLNTDLNVKKRGRKRKYTWFDLLNLKLDSQFGTDISQKNGQINRDWRSTMQNLLRNVQYKLYCRNIFVSPLLLFVTKLFTTENIRLGCV